MKDTSKAKKKKKVVSVLLLRMHIYEDRMYTVSKKNYLTFRKQVCTNIAGNTTTRRNQLKTYILKFR